MPYVTIQAFSRENLLETAARRWAVIREARPDLAPALALQRGLLTRIIDLAATLGAGRLPRLSLPPKYLAAKLARGVPALAGEPIPLPVPVLQPALLQLCDALASGGAGDAALHIRQELESGNIRGFAALEPCRAEGATCSSGIDCCNRFCTSGICGPPDTCSPFDQGCTTKADCCPPAQGQRGTVECIGGFCAFKPPDVPR